MIYYKNFDFTRFTPETYITKDKEGNVYKECNNIFTFDIETTSYYITKNGAINFDYSKPSEWYIKNTNPQALMYIWMMSIDGTAIYGRTWEECTDCFTKIRRAVGEDTKWYCYSHNFSFEFQFIRNIISDFEVFARKERKPIYATTEKFNAEFRCSLFLTNKSLEKAIADLGIESLSKRVGDLEYNVIRTPLTNLSEEELGYCEMDVVGLHYVILEKLAKYKKIKDIPLTQTGQVRKSMKKALWNQKAYIEQVKNSWPDFEQFQLLSMAFYGGYTHSNSMHTGKKMKNVRSFDITSSYPYVLCTQKYPTKKFVESYEKDLNMLDSEHYSYMVDLTLYNVESKTPMRFLSKHKSLTVDADGTDLNNTKLVEDNGRIVSCDIARYVLTDQDINILNSTYTFTYKINEIYTSPKEYLPKELIEFILGYFNDKTMYKDVEGFESKYKEAKEYINAIYGMFVTKIICDPVEFIGAWVKDAMTIEDAEKKLAELKDGKQFCSYSTGVWCAAYARKHLWDLILNVGEDVIYCDTDSVKFINSEESVKFFEQDNLKVKKDIYTVCLMRDIDITLFSPTKPNGEITTLGTWDDEGVYDYFKTLGAKKYAYTKKDKVVHITVSGVSKKTGDKLFADKKLTIDSFRPGLLFDYKYSGKLQVRYNENQEEFTFPDGYTAKEKYGIVLTPTTYLLNITSDYSYLIASESVFEEETGRVDTAKILL